MRKLFTVVILIFFICASVNMYNNASAKALNFTNKNNKLYTNTKQAFTSSKKLLRKKLKSLILEQSKTTIK